MNPSTVSHKKNLHEWMTRLPICPWLILRTVRNKPSFSCFLGECVLFALKSRELGDMRMNTPWPVCPFEKDGLWCRQIIVSPYKKTLFRVTCTPLVLREQPFKSLYTVVTISKWAWSWSVCGHGSPGHWFLVGLSEHWAFLLLKPMGKPASVAVGTNSREHEACNESCLQ